MIPYAKQAISDEDISAVIEALKSDWLTTGPLVELFEASVAEFVGARYAVAVSSGTAALHAMVHSLNLKPGDEVIVPAMTFASTANCVLFSGGNPVFADVDPRTLLIDVESVEKCITHRTKAIIAVDYAGQPCDYTKLQEIATKHGCALLADGAHSLGAKFKDKNAGSLAKATAFSFHPVKPITTGEGGMVVTDDEILAARARRFRNHGITTDARARQSAGNWFYEMIDLGYNYRLCDIQCALGIQQLKKLSEWIRRRQEIAKIYDQAFQSDPTVTPLCVNPNVSHGYHLYAVKWNVGRRDDAYALLRSRGIGVNVHYVPVHLHPYYQKQHATYYGMCPNAEQAYEQLLSLPIFPGMTETDISRTITAIQEVGLLQQQNNSKFVA